jgi:tetratricopeptide (TPR) repeat protein
VAEIYEDRLQQRNAALRHYRAALKARPSFLPALKAIERLYVDEGDWQELVDLIVEMVDCIKSKRRQIHLLEKAARVCEDRLGDDLKLRGILEQLIVLDPESPRAIESLTQLYKRLSLWEKLISLHQREAGFTDGVQETATLFWHCGRVAEENLGDPRRAEGFYRQALMIVPDFLPGLESYCRLLAREGRFEEIFEVSQAELETIDEPRVKSRRLEAMAELLERRLDRRSQAIELVEAMCETCPEEPAHLRRLLSLYSEQGKWDLVAELLERLANVLDEDEARGESWCHLGEVRERKLADEMGALEAYGECLALAPDHPHALNGVIRCGGADEHLQVRIMEEVRTGTQRASSRRLALRQLARVAEQNTGNPAAAIEVRQEAVTDSPDDHEARDMLEAAFAWKRNLPGLSGLWAAAGRTIDEGLLGLLGVSAGINSASLLGAFLGCWGEELEEGLSNPGNRGLWNAALGELSRSGIDVLADPNRISDLVWSKMPDATRRRCAFVLLGEAGGPGLTRAALDRAATVEPASLRLRALLATSDQEAYAEATRAEIRGLAAPELRVKRLLELAAMEGADKTAVFSQAIEEQTHESPVQDELYSRLEEAGQYDQLQMALEAHLSAEDLSVRRRSHLAFKLAQSLERLGAEPKEAFDAYRKSFQSGRERHESLLHMARLSRKYDDTYEAIRCLEAFLTYSTDQAQRVQAGLELSELYLQEVKPPEEPGEYDPYSGPKVYDGGHFGCSAIDVLTRAREESRGTDAERQCISRLAHAHGKVGSPFKAVELFQEILDTEFRAEEADEAVALADLYSGPLNDLQNAEQILTVTFESSPGRADILDRLIDVSRRNGTLHDTCDLMESVARVAAPELLVASDRRTLLQAVAQLLEGSVGRYRKAASIWSELADGASDDVEERRLRVKQSQALSNVPGEEARCRGLMLKLQNAEPFELAPYEGLESVYKACDDYTRLRVVQQVRMLLDSEIAARPIESGRRKTRPSQQLSDEMIENHLVPEGLRDGVLETLRALEPLAVKIWGDRLPTIDALGGKRWRSVEYEQVRDFTELAAECFNIPKVKLYLGDSGPGTPKVFNQGTTSIWFHRGMFEESGAEVCRYLAGYAAGLGWSRVSSLVHLDGRELWHLLEAVLIKHTAAGLSEVTDPRTIELVEEVGGPFNRSLRRRICDAATPHLEVLQNAHCEAWPAMIRTLAVRGGLVLSGQITGAMQAILSGREWRGRLHDPDTQARMKKLPEAADLLRFALGDDYLELRHGCGLDSRPRR